MRPWLVILIALAGLATFDYVVNDADGIEALAVWLLRTGRIVGGAIRQFVMAVFGD